MFPYLNSSCFFTKAPTRDRQMDVHIPIQLSAVGVKCKGQLKLETVLGSFL